MLVCLAEACFGNNIGMEINLPESHLETLFNEAPGRFILTVNEELSSKVEKLFGEDALCLGQVTKSQKLVVKSNEELLVEQNIIDLQKAWRTELC